MKKEAEISIKRSCLKALVLFLVLVLFGCQNNKYRTNIIDQNKTKRPLWMQKVPNEDEQYVYFVGFAVDVDQLKEAEKQARQMAFEKINQYFSVEATTQYTYQKTGQGKMVSDQFQIQSEKITISQIKQLDMYYEIIKHPDKKSQKDCFVLMGVPVKEIKRLKHEKENQLMAIYHLVQQTNKLEEKGAYINALNKINKAQKEIQKTDKKVHLYQGSTLIDQVHLIQTIKDKKRQLLDQFNQVGFYIVKSDVSDTFKQTVNQELKKKLSTYQIKLINEKERKGLNFILKVAIRPSTKYDENLQAFVIDAEYKFILKSDDHMTVMISDVLDPLRQVSESKQKAAPQLAQALVETISKQILKKTTQLKAKFEE